MRRGVLGRAWLAFKQEGGVMPTERRRAWFYHTITDSNVHFTPDRYRSTDA